MGEAFDAIRRQPLPRAPGSGPAPHEVDSLITRAKRHPLGLEFLLNGAHDAVAVTFGVHAFVVDAARDHVKTSPGSPGVRPRA